MNTLEVVFGNSCYYTMKESKISDNILMFNAKLNVGDLSNVENCKIQIPMELCCEEKNTDFKKEHNIIVDNIIKKNKIRVWTGRKDIYSFLVMLYICSIIQKYNYNLYVLYCDEYNEDYPSPSVMSTKELKKLSKLEHKLTNKEIGDNVKLWDNLINENTELRVISNGFVNSVSIDYYDDYILDKLQLMGKVKISRLVGVLMQDIYLHDIMWVYLINRLIKKHRIKIIIDKSVRYFENLIEIEK